MSRSKHTDPRSIRAARRLRAPREGRGAGDTVRRRRLQKKLKESGATWKLEDEGASPPFRPVLRIITRPARTGFHHPATSRHVQEVLEAIGPIALYGLRSVELARAPSGRGAQSPVFGRYQVSGRIILYEQPLPPWRLHGVVPSTTIRQFERAGAIVKVLPEVGATLVDWPEGALNRYMLEQVLLHEVGHHVLQQHKGKRSARIARTCDHESFAQRFAEMQRAALLERRRLAS